MQADCWEAVMRGAVNMLHVWCGPRCVNTSDFVTEVQWRKQMQTSSVGVLARPHSVLNRTDFTSQIVLLNVYQSKNAMLRCE